LNIPNRIQDSKYLLEVNGLQVFLKQRKRQLPVVQDLDFSIGFGERVGIVGESGCGKSITALALMGLLPSSMSMEGSIRLASSRDKFDELSRLQESQLCKIRGKRIGMVFQEPMSALNPVQPIGHQVSESLLLHSHVSRHEAFRQASRMLERVGLPESRFPHSLYPHQLSGGQRQRVVIAIAMACGPDLLIADEPTTALDVTIQAQILRLLSELVEEENMSLILITHDLGVIAENTDRMLVMYAGRCVESGLTEDVFSKLKHPYTRGLFEALPDGEQPQAEGPMRLRAIAGRVPKLDERSEGCVFQTRCVSAQPRCQKEIPLFGESQQLHSCACWFPLDAP